MKFLVMAFLLKQSVTKRPVNWPGDQVHQVLSTGNLASVAVPHS
jgi:hypothetical protein